MIIKPSLSKEGSERTRDERRIKLQILLRSRKPWSGSR